MRILKFIFTFFQPPPCLRIEFTAPYWCHQYLIFGREHGYSQPDIKAMDAFLSERGITVIGFKDKIGQLAQNDFNQESFQVCIVYVAIQWKPRKAQAAH